LKPPCGVTAVTGLLADEFDEIKISDPHLRRFDAQDKLSILDLKLRTKSAKVIDVERAHKA
jgi:hypothetical protein